MQAEEEHAFPAAKPIERVLVAVLSAASPSQLIMIRACEVATARGKDVPHPGAQYAV